MSKSSGGADLRRRASEIILEYMDVAAVLLTSGGGFVYANPAAERMLASRRGLGICRNRLRTTDAQCQQELDLILARAGAPKGQSEDRVAMAQIKGGCGIDLYLQVISIPYGDCPRGLQPGGIVVLIYDRASFRNQAMRHLCSRYGLTDTEARLVGHLIDGCSVRDAAVRMRVAYETARSYLKSVFRKTDTHRQIDLLQKVSGAETAMLQERDAGTRE